jgi:hypothetical protein
MEVLDSADAVIDALGGNTSVSRLFGFWPSAVSNWRNDGRFPADTYPVFEAALAGLDPPRSASRELWKWKMRNGARP